MRASRGLKWENKMYKLKRSIKLLTVGNLTQNEAHPVGHLTFVSKRLSAVAKQNL